MRYAIYPSVFRLVRAILVTGVKKVVPAPHSRQVYTLPSVAQDQSVDFGPSTHHPHPPPFATVHKTTELAQAQHIKGMNAPWPRHANVPQRAVRRTAKAPRRSSE